MLIVSFQTPEPNVPCELTFLSDLGNGAILYGLYYPGFWGCIGWCYLTIAPGVIIATHIETNGGTSITNMWSVKFLATLLSLAPIKAAGEVRWFEHYHRPVPQPARREDGSTLDEVFITERKLSGKDRDVTWKHLAHDDPEHGTGVSAADAWEALTGVPIPNFAATGFEAYMLA